MAGDSIVGAAEAAEQPLGLLDLPRHLLEAVFVHLSQMQRLLHLPLVCKRMRALCERRHSPLWRRFVLIMGRVDPAGDEACMMRWLERRQAAIRELYVFVRHGSHESWLDAAARVLRLLAPAATQLWLRTETLDASAAATTRLLAPLAGMAALEELHVELIHAWTGGEPQLPSLPPRLRRLEFVVRGVGPPPGLGGLEALQELHVSHFQEQRWAPELRRLTQLQRLGIAWDAGPGQHGAEQQHQQHQHHQQAQQQPLELLRELRSLRSLWLTHAQPGVLPPVCEALSHHEQLTSLGVVSPAAPLPREALAHASRLAELRQLTLFRCGLTRLPTSLSSLRQLSSLQLGGNPGLQLSSDDVRCTLARLPALAELAVDRGAIFGEGLCADDLLLLGRACPRLRIDED